MSKPKQPDLSDSIGLQSLEDEEELVETNTLDPAREMRVRASECPALALHHIAHVGVATVRTPYRIVRLDLGGTYFLACFSGSGRILLDGRWQICREGSCCIAPPHAVIAFEAIEGEEWGVSWVRYQQPPDQKPVMSASTPAMAKFGPLPIQSAILGLYYEMICGQAPATVHHWVEIIHTYVLRFAQPWQTEDRIRGLWERVAQRLDEEWSLDRLARECHLSSEHLRRLCRQELGRSPGRHLIYLRMQQAAHLLAATDDKVESVAIAVGYKNPYVFSTTFKKWVGWRPSEYRSKKR